MRLPFIAPFALCLLLAACNLGTAQPTPQAIVTPPPADSKPQVLISAPLAGEEVPVNQSLTVRAVATDPIGVTRVQLFANGTLIRTVPSQNALGDKTLSADLAYTPLTAGDVTLRVLAYRSGSVASDPVEVAIKVVSPLTPTSPISGGGSSNASPVVIPADGVCRVLTTTGVNFRTLPTTSAQSSVIQVLPGGQLAQVLARLGDNTWWKVNYGGRTGWLSNSFVTLSGNCLNIPSENPLVPTSTPTPTITPTPPRTNTPVAVNTAVPMLPDLVVANIAGAQTVTLSGGTRIESYSIVVTNTALGAAGQFGASLTVNGSTVIDLGVVGGLNPGQSVTLVAPVSFTTAGTSQLQVTIDPSNQISEVSKVNNSALYTVTVSN